MIKSVRQNSLHWFQEFEISQSINQNQSHYQSNLFYENLNIKAYALIVIILTCERIYSELCFGKRDSKFTIQNLDLRKEFIYIYIIDYIQEKRINSIQT